LRGHFFKGVAMDGLFIGPHLLIGLFARPFFQGREHFVARNGK
jgi:hypothetical protein